MAEFLSLHLGKSLQTDNPVIMLEEALFKHVTVWNKRENMPFLVATLYQWLSQGGGGLFIDTEGSSDTKNMVQAIGHLSSLQDRIKILDFVDPESSQSYNPAHNGTPSQIATRLLELVPVTNEPNPGCDYYRQAALYALTVIIAALQEALSTSLTVTPSLLARALLEPEILVGLESVLPHGPAREQLALFLDAFRVKGQLNSRHFQRTYGGVAGRLMMLSQGKFGKIFDTAQPSLRMAEVRNNNQLLYVRLPAQGQSEASAAICRLLLSELTTTPFFKNGPPFLVVTPSIESSALQTILTQGRAQRLSAWVTFDSASDLLNASATLQNAVLSNTATKIVFAPQSEADTALFAKFLDQGRDFMFRLRNLQEGQACIQNNRQHPFVTTPSLKLTLDFDGARTRRP